MAGLPNTQTLPHKHCLRYLFAHEWHGREEGLTFECSGLISFSAQQVQAVVSARAVSWLLDGHAAHSILKDRYLHVCQAGTQNDKDALKYRSLGCIFSQGRKGPIFTALCLPSLNFNGVSRLRLNFEMSAATTMWQHRSRHHRAAQALLVLESSEAKIFASPVADGSP